MTKTEAGSSSSNESGRRSSDYSGQSTTATCRSNCVHRGRRVVRSVEHLPQYDADSVTCQLPRVLPPPSTASLAASRPFPRHRTVNATRRGRPTASDTKCSREQLSRVQRDYGHRRSTCGSSVAEATESASFKLQC